MDRAKPSWRVVAILALTAWGVCAFGAVYPWAFVPLFVGCASIATVMLLRRDSAAGDRLLVAALGLVAIAIAVQLIPLPPDVIRSISPGTDAFLRQYVIAYPLTGPHALSVEPRETTVALAAFAALSLLLVGLARTLTHRDALQFARGLAILGVALALVAVVQQAFWNGKIYGFWTPYQEGQPFGPFVNRNHFAGWMLMALPLTLGYFCGRVARGMPDAKPGLRARVIWLSSADASETILLGLAVLLMAVALMLSMSRSGFLGLLAALVVSGLFVVARQTSGPRRILVAGYLTLVLAATIGWTGFDRLAARFAAVDTVSVDGRFAIWSDAWRIAQRFPLVGTGINTFGTTTLFYQSADPTRHFGEAHNDYLQLLAEGGVLVCAPAIAALVAVVSTVRRRFREVRNDSTDYWIRVGAVTGVFAVALQETVEFSLQMPGNATLFIASLAIAMRPSSASSPQRVR